MLRASLFFASLALLATSLVSRAHAQLPECSGHDPAAASTEFEAGNALLTQAIDQASHRHADRAHQLATEALTHFDHQCELGDSSAYAERGASLLLLGEPLRSAQSYDAYLATHPLDSLEARTRRRIEPNLQPATIELEIQNPRGHLFLNDLDFGPLPRTTNVRVPLGEYRIEVRVDDIVVATEPASLSAETTFTHVSIFLPPETTGALPPVVPVVTALPVIQNRALPARTDYVPFYVVSAIATGVGLALGVGLVIAADERARTYNSLCFPTVISGCSSVLSERDTFLGVSVAGFVLGAIGIAGLIATYIFDQNESRGRVRLSFGPTSFAVSGTF